MQKKKTQKNALTSLRSLAADGLSLETELVSAGREEIARAGVLLRQGGLVGMPTETVYGLAANAFDSEALARVFEAKGRPTFDPLIVHVSPGLLGEPSAASGGAGTASETPQRRAERWLEELGRRAILDLAQLNGTARARTLSLMAAFWPGPLTLLLPRTKKVPDLATSGLPRVGLRMPAHPVARALIDAAGVPLAAPSANRFGRISPTRAEHVLAELAGRIHLILDAGPCAVGIESSVVSIEPLALLRAGGVSRDALEAAIGLAPGALPVADRPDASLGQAARAAPGLLESHYAPTKKLTLLGSIEEIEKNWDAPSLGALVWSEAELEARGLRSRYARVAALCSGTGSSEEQTREAARNLFSRLRELDEAPEVQAIVVQRCPYEQGLGLAIADRLGRAQGR